MAQLSVTTEGNATRELRLSHALLLWGGDGRDTGDFVFARLHEIHRGRGGRAEISEQGRGVSPDGLHDLLQSLSQSNDETVAVRPERVLHESHARCAWWRPASPATLLFKTPELGGIVQGKVPLPPLLFVRKRDVLALAALGKNKRPDGSDPIFVAPFFNIFQRGDVCSGSVPFASVTPGAAGIDATERAFFGSYFTHPNHRDVHTLHPNGVHALWKELLTGKAARARFPMRWLAPGNGRSHAAKVADFILEN